MSCSPWLVRHGVDVRQTRRPSLRLFCFPYAGGSARIYAGWSAEFGEDVDVVAVQPPGRLGRMDEPAFTDMASMVAALKTELLPMLDVPFVMFGYSLGSRVAYELCRQLQDEHGKSPELLIAAASVAPHRVARGRAIHALPDDAFLSRLATLNGTPREILDNRELMEILLPALRADFRIADTYHTEARRLRAPVAALAGLDDPEVSYPDLLAWRELTDRFIGVDYLAGDHFFINQTPGVVIERVRRLLVDILRRAEADVGTAGDFPQGTTLRGDRNPFIKDSSR